MQESSILFYTDFRYAEVKAVAINAYRVRTRFQVLLSLFRLHRMLLSN